MSRSKYFTEYDAGPYFYVIGQATLYMFSVSDAKHLLSKPGSDRTFRHWIASFNAS